jgi:hypothetical protein
MEKISDEKFEELELQYGEIAVVSTKLGDVAFRSPKRAEYERYLSILFDEKKRHKAQEVLIRACRIYPSTEQLDQMIEKAPGIIVTCSGPVLELGGQAGEPEVRKSKGENS